MSDNSPLMSSPAGYPRKLVVERFICVDVAPELLGALDPGKDPVHMPTKAPKRAKSSNGLPIEEPIQGIEDQAELGGRTNQYVIEQVLRYDPRRGYFVKWKGYHESENSWQLPQDMPSGVVGEMGEVRQQYEDLFHSPDINYNNMPAIEDLGVIQSTGRSWARIASLNRGHC
jgi:hypothetical protein